MITARLPMLNRVCRSQGAMHWAAAAIAALTVGCTSTGDTAAPPAGPDGSSDASGPPPSPDSSIPNARDSTAGDSPGPEASTGVSGDATLDQAPGRDADASGMTDAGIADGDSTLESSAASDAPTVTAVPTPPPLLSATGFFTSVGTDGGLMLAAGVETYQPLYTLWADGATKDRWIYLPPGSKIDTTNLDHWSFPVGTKFWKEFDVSGQRIETRLVWRYGPGADDYLYVTYWWNPEAGISNDAELVSVDNGAQNVNGTTHDIPTQQDCLSCHGALKEHVLGFGAIELNHTLPGSNIHSLIEAGALTQNPNLPDLVIPGNTTVQAALGYLHANCGNCHNDTPGASGVPQPPLNLRVLVGTKTVQETQAYKTAVNQPPTAFSLLPYRIAGQEPDASYVTHDMETRGARGQMPPTASKIVDDAGVATVNAWIMTLPKHP